MENLRVIRSIPEITYQQKTVSTKIEKIKNKLFFLHMSILKELLKSGQLYLEDYSEKAIVIRKKPELKTPPSVYKDELISLGGKYNPNLQGGSGWIFSKKKKEQIELFMEAGIEGVQKAKKKTEMSAFFLDIEKKFESLSLETEKHELVDKLKKLSQKLEGQLKVEKKPSKKKPEKEEHKKHSPPSDSEDSDDEDSAVRHPLKKSPQKKEVVKSAQKRVSVSSGSDSD